MQILLAAESVPHPEKWRWHNDKKKWILLAVGLIVVTVNVIHAGRFRSSKITSARSDHEPPGTPLGTPLPRNCGLQSRESKWPWTVDIYTRYYPNWTHTFALGTLINDQYVLSSAYELNGRELRELRILLGETTSVHTADHSYFKERVYRDVFMREFMESDDFSRIYTVLLRMDRPVTFNGRIQPICLPWMQPQMPQQLLIFPEEKLDLISSSVHLEEHGNCLAIWFPHASDVEKKSATSICVKMPDVYVHCHALSGSPLLGIYRDGRKDRFVQYGIKYYRNCTEGLQIYTNVTEQMKWIEKVVKRKN